MTDRDYLELRSLTDFALEELCSIEAYFPCSGGPCDERCWFKRGEGGCVLKRCQACLRELKEDIE